MCRVEDGVEKGRASLERTTVVITTPLTGRQGEAVREARSRASELPKTESLWQVLLGGSQDSIARWERWTRTDKREGGDRVRRNETKASQTRMSGAGSTLGWSVNFTRPNAGKLRQRGSQP